jgi:hypothetical protein
MAEFLLELYDSDAVAGYIDVETLEFQLTGQKLNWIKVLSLTTDTVNRCG